MEIQGCVRVLHDAPACALASALLRAPCGARLGPLLPELQRQLLYLSPLIDRTYSSVLTDAASGADADADGLGDTCDTCPDDPGNDVDGDG